MTATDRSLDTAPEDAQRRRRRLLLKIAVAAVVVIGLLLVLYLGCRFLTERPVTYDTMADHFKYGSTRGDLLTGVPVWIWQAMPLVCADILESVTGDRLAPDYRDRVARYSSADDAAERRRALSREGYKALGFLYETDADGRERTLPIGTTQRRSLGLDRTYINCAVCHVSTVRQEPEGPAELVVGMPANLFNLYDFEHFLFECGKSSRFSFLQLAPEMAALGADLDLLDEYAVYPLAIAGLREAINFLEDQAGFSVRQPEWGPGRNDTFTNNKVFLYGYPWRDLVPDYWTTGEVHPENVGTVDFPSIWLQGKRKQRSDGRPMQLHWDGNNDDVEERNLNASLATSALPPVIDHEAIECVELWLEDLEPPAWPFPIDRQLAARGEPIYRQYCADCHGAGGRDFTGRWVGYVTDIDDVGTDRYRLDNYTGTLAANMGMTYAKQPRRQQAHPCPDGTVYRPRQPRGGDGAYGGSPAGGYDEPAGAPATYDSRVAAVEAEEDSYRYTHYRKTNGYANSPLDGLWLRAPYLHNGSVPHLRALLEPSDRRPVTFYRGNDLYDPIDVGFVSTAPRDRDGRGYFLFDTAVPGNGNRGHEGARYGTELPPADKAALIEYLKTF